MCPSTRLLFLEQPGEFAAVTKRTAHCMSDSNSSSSQSTPATLLERLRHHGEREAWTRFVRLYTPLLFYWAQRAHLNEHDAADLVQDVFALLLQKLPAFAYRKEKSFRCWLRTVT